MAKGISLHIGINSVNPEHYDGWNGQLYACENDAKLYEQIARQGGFESHFLLTTQATSDAVLGFIKDTAPKLEQGDCFFISYSGHGGTLPDANNDEEDKLDETWCLYDRQLVDDELFEAFSKFKEGVKILVFADSCHSGTSVRVGPNAALKTEHQKQQSELEAMFPEHRFIERKMPDDKWVPVYLKNQPQYDKVLEAPAVDTDKIPPYVMLFAACQDSETAKEWGANGVFTAGLKKVFSSSIESYEDLYNKLQAAVPPRVQKPNLFRYGNVQFNFAKDKPFILSPNAVINLAEELKTPATNAETTEATNLIIHANDASAVKDLERTNVTRGTERGPVYGIKETNQSTAGAWDQAYQEYLKSKDNETPIDFIEPDIKTVYARKPVEISRGNDNKYLVNWPVPEEDANEFIWHLSDQFSQLKSAADAVLKLYGNDINNPALRIKIGHIDTGYLDHVSNPKFLNRDLGTSFVNKDPVKDGRDRLNTKFPAEQDGHGCATLAILAGNNIEKTDDSYAGYLGYFGGVPFAEVIPVRICDTVYNAFNANDVADGIDYAVDHGCEVITMSMAGYPTKRVAQAVNRAYEKGVIVVTAAGNNWVKGFQKLTPKAVMYPARFDRVIAATGVCCNHEPYDLSVNSWYKTKSEGGEFMQGNWGPEKAMKTALAAYTPNLPWATTTQSYKFARAGGGTSSATPQVAAAAALWILYNRAQLQKAQIQDSWKKVEAARTALFRSASKEYPDYKKYYGNGELKALDALTEFDFTAELNELKPAAEARVRFFGIDQFIGQWIKSRDANEATVLSDDNLKEMLSLETIQLLYRDERLHQYLDAVDYESEEGVEFLKNKAARKKFASLIKTSPYASEFLKNSVKEE